MKLKKYQKKFEYSYTLGIYPTLELLQNQNGHINYVLASSKAEDAAGIEKICQACSEKNIDFFINDQQIENISPKENCWAIGVFNKYEQEVEKGQNHIVLVNPSDMGNLGTILRTMLGFGFKDLAIIKPGADIFNPKSLRASMGAVFSIKFQYFENFEEYSAKFPSQKLYPFMLGAKTKLNEVQFQAPFSLILGSEGKGLDQDFLKVGTPIYIPQTKLVDSLNLSVAAGVAMSAAFMG